VAFRSEILVHLRLRQAQPRPPGAADARSCAKLVLRESQVEVRARRPQFDLLAVGQDGTEGLLGRVEVAQAGLGKASPRKGLDAIVG